jgi:hypothetical protein
MANPKRKQRKQKPRSLIKALNDGLYDVSIAFMGGMAAIALSAKANPLVSFTDDAVIFVFLAIFATLLHLVRQGSVE